MGRRRNGQRVDARRQQSFDVAIAGTRQRVGYKIPLLAVGIDDAGELHPRQVSQHTGMVASHDTDAHNPNAQQIVVRTVLHGVHHVHDIHATSPTARTRRLFP